MFQSGFLDRQSKTSVALDDSACDLSAPHQPIDAAPPDAAQHGANWKLALDLLRGPTDEKRFVGLLLVTKLLPTGDETAVRQVHGAVGEAFVSRLLLPLRTSQPAAALPADPDAWEKQAAAAALGLAVASSFAQLPELAQSDDMVQRLPLFLNVARAGGLTSLLSPAAPAAAAAGGSGDASVDAAALHDALECATAVAAASEEGCAVARQSGAVSAACRVLASPAALASPPLLALAVRLLAAVLSGPGRMEYLLRQPSDVLQLVPALARVFALPASPPLPAQQQGQVQERRQQLAALQLEALHVLLLVLPLPLPTGRHLHDALASAARHACWPHDLRAGLGVLLRGKVAGVQRHSALQLAAAVVDMVGPEWTLGGPTPAPGGSASDASAGSSGGLSPEAFFQVLVEVTRIETSVLLLDALGPSVPVPNSTAPGTAAAQWRPPALRAPAPCSASLPPEEEGEEGGAGASAMEVDAAAAAEDQASADLARLYRVLSSDAERSEMEQQMQAQYAAAAEAAREDNVRRVDETPIPTDMRWEGPTEAAGARAARVLPACFELLEACVECLAANSQCSEALAAMDEQGGGTDEEGLLLGGGVTLASAGDSSASLEGMGAASSCLPVLGDAVAQRALRSLEEAVEGVLQFLEQSRCQPNAMYSPLLLASARVLGRFCSEVPLAFGPRLRQLLPFLLSLRTMPHAEQEGAQQQAAGVPALAPPAEGVVFLLPTLLQVAQMLPGGAEPGLLDASEQAAWASTLASPSVLRQLVVFAANTAMHCSKYVITALAAAADDHLVFACQLLLAVLLPAVVPLLPPPAGQQHPGTGAGAAMAAQLLQAAQAVELTLPVLLPLEMLAPHRPVVPTEEATPEQHVLHVRLLSIMAALAAVVVAAAVDLQRRQPPALMLDAQAQQGVQRCSVLVLAGLQSTAQLLKTLPTNPRHLDALRLQQAATTAAEDPEIQSELAANLETLCWAALVLLASSPVFAQAAAQHPWLTAMAEGDDLGGLAARGGSAADVLQRLLAAVREVRAAAVPT